VAKLECTLRFKTLLTRALTGWQLNQRPLVSQLVAAGPRRDQPATGQSGKRERNRSTPWRSWGLGPAGSAAPRMIRCS